MPTEISTMSKTVLTEDQPRYKIDSDTSEKEIKILSEEQERVINKLLKAAGHILNDEERDLIHKLQEKLNRETERVNSLKKVKITDKPLDEYLSDYNKTKGSGIADKGETGLDGEIAPVKEKKVTHIVGFKPEEVVRRYIECWNQQKFGAEFDCFSRDFLTHDRSAYINARHLSFQQQMNNGGMRIDFGEIISNETKAGQAEVIASKTITQGNRKPQEETDRYQLKLEKSHWLIVGVQPYS